MGLFFADLVREASHGTGAGDFPLEGALPGHRRFADAVPPGARFHYCIAGVTNSAEWETGEGEIGSGGTLIRMPLASSAGGGAVSFSAGLKTVALTVAAAWFADQDEPAAIGDVAGLEGALDGKAPLSHDHDGAYAPLVHVHSFASLSDRPATLAGYGITDAAPADHDHSGAYQPLDADLAAIAALPSAADKLPYASGTQSWAMTDLTGYARSLLGQADAAAARDALGTGTLAVQNADAVAITGGSVAAGAVTSTGPITAGAALNLRRGRTSAEFNAELAAIYFGYGGSDDYRHALVTRHTPGETGNGIDFYLHKGGTDPIGGIPTHRAATIESEGLAVFGRISATGTLRIGGTDVVGARATGWAAPSGSAERSGFDTASVTIEQLAQRVKALIDDLVAHGLIGA